MKYDVVVIGSGPGGYVGAIRAAQLGMKVAIIEKYNTLGGTCLNVGCIPSKALLDSSEHYHNAVERFAEHGIETSEVKINMKQMIKRKNEVVDQTCKGIDFLMKKNKIDVYQGTGSFVTKNLIAIENVDGRKEIEADKVIIATGSKPITPEMFNYDKVRVITSTEALNIDKVPAKMVIIGGGVIGLELGSVFARLGTSVDVVEYMDRILPTMDTDCGKELMRSLKKLGINFYLSHSVTGVKSGKTSCSVSVQKRDSEEKFDIKADYCLVAIGRKPYTDGLNLESIGIQKDEKGRIAVNDHLETNVPGIYAIGDVVQGAMLAHKAEEEGILVAEIISGAKPHIDYNLIPGVVYTWPEVAAVGKTEEELKSAGIPYKSGKFPFKALGRARASMDTEGMVKVLAHKDTDEILGVHMVGPRVADVIMEAVALMEFRASAEDMSRISHPHPTYTEAVKEAALAATGNRALHV
ncbi:MAG: dihydrolipoyl dehydrogenase [Saprospiraceae bacterium]|nr:dihydrolipoyl dehydrogenase [Saprospiraceae bacterium]MBP6566259.1 dihydrolipoyl dehydrogenase [Saprospiraceae bacterium]